MQQDTNNTIVGTITVPPETLAAIRIASNMPQLTDNIIQAVNLWEPIGTDNPVELGDIHQHLADAAELIAQLRHDITLLRDAVLAQDNNI